MSLNLFKTLTRASKPHNLLKSSSWKPTAQLINTRQFTQVLQPTDSQLVATSDLKDNFSPIKDQLSVDPSSPAVVSLLARLKLEFSDPEIIRQVLTHKSYRFGRAATNERLRSLGKKAISLYVTEHYHIKHPQLPTESMEDILSIHFSPYALAAIGKAFGMGPLVMFKPEQEPEERTTGFSKIIGKSVQALVGGIYHDKGAKACRDFIQKYLLSRDISIAELLPLTTPKQTLAALLRNLGKEEPISRLLRETGRLSNRPIFIVGVYSGEVKLGESYGSSLKMAEFRACKDALSRYYLKELKDYQLPSDMEKSRDDEENISFFPTKLSSTPTRL